jgi:uncharacterized protein (DUF1015 family)
MESLEEVHDLCRIGPIEIARRLIRDDHIGIMDQSTSDTGPLDLTTREFFDIGMTLREESDLSEDLRHSL